MTSKTIKAQEVVDIAAGQGIKRGCLQATLRIAEAGQLPSHDEACRIMALLIVLESAERELGLAP